MKSQINTEHKDGALFPKSLKDAYEKVDKIFLSESIKRFNHESKENDRNLQQYNKDYFILTKDLLILSGTIFGSSIALATGKEVNSYFIIGEFFLFLSIVSGLIMLLAHLKAKEWEYAFDSKNSIESFLLGNKSKIEKFHKEKMEELVDDYKKIINANQSGLLYLLLKHISIEKWPTIFVVVFLFGVFLILFSLI